MITFPNTHSKHISSSIAKVGRLLYQNKIQTSAHPPLRHRWNTTELTYKAYNLHNKYYFSIQISYISNMEILWNICICAEWERYDTRAQSSISQTVECTSLCPKVLVRDAFRISTCSLFSRLCFQCRNSRHSLFFCWWLKSVAVLRAPPSGLGWIACIRRKASCTEPRGPYHDGLVWIHVLCHP